jgi:NitT/TauT family transport system substrate-binding protein
MHIAVPDLVTNSYFPALAAEELGYYAAEGLEAHVELLGAAPGPVDEGIDPARDGVRIGPVPGMDAPEASFGVLAAKALEAGQLDGFWANALGSETAVRRGVGKILADVRRGDGPAAARHYTFSALVTTDTLLARDPAQVAAAVRAIVRVQRALQVDPHQATSVGDRRFPPDAAAMIATLVEGDLPFYDPAIAESAVDAMNRFAHDLGLVMGPVPYEQVVAKRFRPLWHGKL